MEPFKISSCMAPNMDFLCTGLAELLTASLSMPAAACTDIPWQERERRLDSGEIGLCWICGLPYVWKADRPAPSIGLLAAPVMRAPRYQNRPVYYSDVIVRADSPYNSLEDLRGARWAYNEPGSHSGYNVVRAELGRRGERAGYFARAIEAGSHQNALRMILAGEVDGAAIDTTVLELELRLHPEWRALLRAVGTLGPSPIPPWVISRTVSEKLRAALKEALLHLHEDPRGRDLLARAGMARLVAVTDRDYDPIREMDRLAQGVRLGRVV
jgi:phosphonate transport system substrate-binding protein